MFNKLVIIGAGGQGKVIADLALKIGYTDICFLDDKDTEKIFGIDVVGTIEDVEKFDNDTTDFVIAIGDNHTRKSVAERYNLNYVNLIHPTAQIGKEVKMGVGNVVLSGAVINASVRIGNHCIINTLSIVEHDNILNDFVHISPRATLSGSVQIGEKTQICTSATIINNISVCSDVILGAGAVAIKDINESGTYVGVPARKIK